MTSLLIGCVTCSQVDTAVKAAMAANEATNAKKIRENVGSDCLVCDLRGEIQPARPGVVGTGIEASSDCITLIE